jgi:hypothetical protein
MTLPEICPLDENEGCKGRECHLFCLEWRNKEPICLIGYSTTSKMRSCKANLNEDTYAEKTFRKLGRQSTSKKRNISEKGDWIPRRATENSQTKTVDRREEKSAQNLELRKIPVKDPATESEKTQPRHNERHMSNEAENASFRLETRLKKDSIEENPIIFAKLKPEIQHSPKTPEKVVSKNKHTTIFAPFDADKKKEIYPLDREEKTKKPSGDREKSKRHHETKDIDLPDVYDEEFWS